MFDPNRLPAVSAVEAHQQLTAPAGATTGGAGSAAEGIAARPLLVDVRELDEIVQSRADAVVVLPLSTFMLRHRELPTDRPLLMICHSGARSAQATAFLLANGWTDVTNVAGGMLSWEQSGLKVRRGALAPGEGDLPG